MKPMQKYEYDRFEYLYFKPFGTLSDKEVIEWNNLRERTSTEWRKLLRKKVAKRTQKAYNDIPTNTQKEK